MNASLTIDNVDSQAATALLIRVGKNMLSIFAGILPITVFCMGIICISWPEEYMGIKRFVNAWFLIYCFIALHIGVIIGYGKSFPRWSLPYFGIVALFAFYLMNVRIPPSGTFGILSWIPFIIALIIGGSIFGSNPLQRLGRKINEDWTILVFTLFSGFPLIAWIMFDEVNPQFKLPFLMGLYGYGIFGAICYLLCSKLWQRILVLFLSIYIIAVLSILGPDIFWHNQIDWIVSEVEITSTMMVKSALVGAILTLIPFSPGLLIAALQHEQKEWNSINN